MAAGYYQGGAPVGGGGGPYYQGAAPVGGGGPYYQQGAPGGFQVQSKASMAWSSGLCSCTDDCGNCCMTCCCPCVTFGRIAHIADQGNTSCCASAAIYTLLAIFTGCGCLYSCMYRSKVRSQYSLQESPCNDCLVHCCCETCALCQEYRELKAHGFDMHKDWQENMQMQGRQANMPPGMQGAMMR